MVATLENPLADSSAAAEVIKTSILDHLSFEKEPLAGTVFSKPQLQQALDYVRGDCVRLVTANVNDSFGGIFGQVRDIDFGTATSPEVAEVSIVIRKLADGKWSVEGSSSTEREPNSERVAALLLAAKIEKTANGRAEFERLAETLGRTSATIHLSRTDIRSGILHWDDNDSRSVLEQMRLARVEPANRDVANLLRNAGLKPLVELYPFDEIDSRMHTSYAFESKNLIEQDAAWANFLANHRPSIEEIGAEIVIEDSFDLDLVDSGDYYGEIAEAEDDSMDWFGFEYGIRLGREKVNILPCLVEYLRTRPMSFRLTQFAEMPEGQKIPVQMPNSDRYVAIPAKRMHKVLSILGELFNDEQFDEETGLIKVHRLRAAQLTGMRNGSTMVDMAPDYLMRSAADIAALKPKSIADAPTGFLASLRPYQQDGFEWLQFLREQELGGILADDMGLGKTIQTLCHLHREKAEGRANLPCLILAPKSVVPNWEKEANKFAPSLTVLQLDGPKRKQYYGILQHVDLVVTSYPVLLRDAEELLEQEFHYVVLDEAHTIKNSTSQITQTAYKIKARHRLALSGTPIENHLGELWSLFHFLMPGYLGSEQNFTRCYRVPIEKHRDEASQKRLAERVKPLMLRRTKTLVAKDLPPKTEIIRSVELNPQQVELYEAVRASLSKDLTEEIKSRGLEASKILILDALMKLRQVCCHPQLLKLPSAKKAKRSAKLDMLMEMLPTMVEEGRRILIFSQFTSMLELIQAELQKEGIPHIKLTGDSPNRGELCDWFQEGKVPVFLISLRAGGTGITLTKADTVIHYDPWWNPALESQATDRAYRIGQKNPVFVYKMISRGTIEDKIVMLQQKKRALFEGILEGTPQKLEFSESDLANLFAPIEQA